MRKKTSHIKYWQLDKDIYSLLKTNIVSLDGASFGTNQITKSSLYNSDGNEEPNHSRNIFNEQKMMSLDHQTELHIFRSLSNLDCNSILI